MSSTANAEHLRALVEPALAERELELFDIQIGGGVVRIMVDRPGGIDLEQVTAATRLINDLLDEQDPLPGRYTLEVTSPGIERPLRTPEHFRRAVGETVRVRTRPEFEGERRVDGDLVSADEDEIVVQPKDGEALRLAYSDVDRARTVFDWDKAVAKERGGA